MTQAQYEQQRRVYTNRAMPATAFLVSGRGLATWENTPGHFSIVVFRGDIRELEAEDLLEEVAHVAFIKARRLGIWGFEPRSLRHYTDDAQNYDSYDVEQYLVHDVTLFE